MGDYRCPDQNTDDAQRTENDDLHRPSAEFGHPGVT